MALDLVAKYGIRVNAASTDFPFGSPRAESAESVNDGFPFQVDWIKDLMAPWQKFMELAGLTPDGVVNADQYLKALFESGIIPLSAIGQPGTATINSAGHTLEISPTAIAITKDSDGSNMHLSDSSLVLEGAAPTDYTQTTHSAFTVADAVNSIVTNPTATEYTLGTSAVYVSRLTFDYKPTWVLSGSTMTAITGPTLPVIAVFPIRILSINFSWTDVNGHCQFSPLSGFAADSGTNVLLRNLHGFYVDTSPNAGSSHKFYIEYEQL